MLKGAAGRGVNFRRKVVGQKKNMHITKLA
jgi:hypothetical protein